MLAASAAAVAQRIEGALFEADVDVALSMTEDLRDCHTDELPRRRAGSGVRRVATLPGAARARSANATSLAIYDELEHARI